MLIDWTTVLFQAVNFLILMVLLKHFLYDRVMNAMKEREDRIASRLEEAELKRKEAEEEKDTYLDRNRRTEEERKQILAEARTEAEQRKQDLHRQARTEVEKLKQNWLAGFARDREAILNNLQETVVSQAAGVSRRVLRDLAGADLEKEAAGRFIQQLKGLNDERTKETPDANQKLLIASSFDLDEKTRTEITRVIHEQFGSGREVAFQASAELILGLELKLPGRKISWNISRYLADFEENALAGLAGGVSEVEPDDNAVS